MWSALGVIGGVIGYVLGLGVDGREGSAMDGGGEDGGDP